jgi:ATP phosphoribosyltransferase
MTAAPMILAIPSKGRLKEQVEAWLGDAGFPIEAEGGERGYRAQLRGLSSTEVRLLSAGDIAAGLAAGDVHVGVTGEDLLREQGEDLESRVMLLRALGFGRADLVVAAPQSWIDVDGMSDVDEVAQHYLARTGRRMRVATKYAVQTRAFFARHGVADYRIVESNGATEGAPAAGAAELVVDITTTGATLAANSLKILADGVILKSQAQLAAALTAPWTPAQLGQLRRLLSVAEAKARAKALSALHWPADADARAVDALRPFLARGASMLSDGVLSPTADLFDLAAALAEAGVGPVSVSRPDYVFETACDSMDRLERRLGL